MQCEACGHENIDGARFCSKCGAVLPVEQKGPDPMIGQLVGGRFRVTGVLGEGGMGIVYVGEQHMGSTVRKVAIKTLHGHLSKDPSVIARFHRECGTVAQLEHPNTIKVYDFGSTTDGTLYIAMEFVAGRPLADVIREEGALHPDRVVKIMRQTCGALDEAHQTGIVHRDLKPENIILTNRAGETDFVKVLDFGIAARSESADAQKEQKLTQQGMVLGTPPYMSPEQFTGKALDARSDVYSLGVMAYEMLTGRLPFDADTPWQWATQHMTAQPIPFETSAPSKAIPPGLRQAILRSLAKDREQRQGSAREFFAELSDGGRMTVESPPHAGAAKTGTAAMEAPPDFGAASPRIATVQGTAIGDGTPMGVAMPAPAAARVPAAPFTSGPRGKQGGNKGLIVGLGGLGAVLLAAMAVIAARSLGGGDDDIVETNPLGTVASPGTGVSGPVAIDPLETPPPTPTAVDTGAAPADPTPNPPQKPTTGTTPKTPATTPKTPTTTPPTTTTPTTPPANPPPSGGGACDSCVAQAESGQIASAIASARNCQDASKRNQCTGKLRTYGSSAVNGLAKLGKCSEAQALVAAGKSAGVNLAGGLAKTSCQ